MLIMAGWPVVAEAKTAPDYSAYEAVFDAQYYYDTYSDLQTAIGMDPGRLLEHFVNFGIREGRSGRSEFNLSAYMSNNIDLLAAFGSNYAEYCRHFDEHGRSEGRVAVKEGGMSNVLGTYTTYYDESQQRAVNVELAASRINDIVLQPGQAFSFSQSVQSRTAANGYVLGPSYAAGREVISIGGGICQVSSNLYVTMILSGVSPTERYTHSALVDYVPLGLDATIAENSKDLKFTNQYGYPIRIQAVAEGGELTVSIVREPVSA